MQSPRPYTRRNPQRKRRASTIKIPVGVGSHVHLVFSEMQRQNIRYDDVEDGAGVRRATCKAWRHKNYPNLDSIEAVLGFLGWDFVPIPRAKVLPLDLVAQLSPIADRFGLSMPAATEALIALVAGIHTRFADANDVRNAEINCVAITGADQLKKAA